jgi:hypothetical protein
MLKLKIGMWYKTDKEISYCSEYELLISETLETVKPSLKWSDFIIWGLSKMQLETAPWHEFWI